MSCPHALDDGAYVLGALSPDDRLAFERHLADCADCSRSVRELAGLPGLMARVPAATVADDGDAGAVTPPVPDTLLPALVRRARRTERRRTWVVAGLVAAAAVLVGAAVGAATLGGDDGPSATPPASSSSPEAPAATTAAPQEMEPVGEEPIAVSVSLTEVGWGTRLDMTCRYAEGKGGRGDAEQLPAYAMFVTRTDGTVEQVASWKGLPGKTMQLVAATAASRADIKDVFVRAADGTEVLWLES